MDFPYNNLQDGANLMDEPDRTHHITYGEGIHKIEVLTVLCGKDLVVTISGGHQYHVGATALAVPRPSLNNPDKISATASVLAVLSHKDDEIARQAALSMASTLNCTVAVSVGIHIDDASEKDIRLLNDNYSYAMQILLQDLRQKFARRREE